MKKDNKGVMGDWKQPHIRYIEMDDLYALMSEQTYKGLKELVVHPSSIFNGMMWRQIVKGTEYLFRYVFEGDQVVLYRREILVV